MGGLTLQEGKFLVRLARRTIKHRLETGFLPETPEVESERLKEKRGVFVTLKRASDDRLRGCIGFIYPLYPLVEATIRAAASAAFEDPRFPPVTLRELPGLKIEVSVLTVPELIKVSRPSDYLSIIKCGRDGLIAERGFYKGVLLPQVCTEFGWDVKSFLSHTCLKAGLPPDAWMDLETKIYRFQAQIFEEVEPEGEVAMH